MRYNIAKSKTHFANQVLAAVREGRNSHVPFNLQANPVITERRGRQARRKPLDVASNRFKLLEEMNSEILITFTCGLSQHRHFVTLPIASFFGVEPKPAGDRFTRQVNRLRMLYLDNDTVFGHLVLLKLAPGRTTNGYSHATLRPNTPRPATSSFHWISFLLALKECIAPVGI
jgi:hypothetical protein